MTKKISHIAGQRLKIMICYELGFFLIPFISFSQCSAPISNFPYNESFEISNGKWVSGGSSSDWAWGVPSKSVINAAATGSRCWITGGLNNKSYNVAENSWLQTPCFDFTNLNDPYIQCKVFWETERNIDGANFQYSEDNGATWQLLGNVTEQNPCLTENWFNSIALPSLSNQDAWSGTSQGSRQGCSISNGSGGWVTAKHHAPMLAGKPNVIFRFAFAANTSCNDFDGFAIDDFHIEEAPSSVASFTYDCSSNLRVNFKNTSTLCPTSFLWDFDDPSSGANNTSNVPNPTHAYTLGGKYRVKFTVSGPGNSSSTYVLPDLEIIADIAASVVVPVRCAGDTTGSVTVNFAGDSSNINYRWDSDPLQSTRTAVHLGAGNYNITLLNDEGCPASAKVTLGEPKPIVYRLNTTKPDCNVNNGSIDLSVFGGFPPYTYTWSPNVSTSSSANNLVAGIYTIVVADSSLCTKVIPVDLSSSGDLNAAIANYSNVSCFNGNDGMALVTASGGNAPYSYSWSSGSNSALANSLATGTYYATVTDRKGCQAFATAVIAQPALLSAALTLKNTSCGIANGSAIASAYGGTRPYQFEWTPGNITSASISNLAPGQYIVAVKDSNNCIIYDTATIAPSSAINVRLSHSDILCYGEITGNAEAFVTGGTQPYNFTWTNGTDTLNGNPIVNVAAGTYDFNVEDATGCSVKAPLIIKQPEVLKVVMTSEPSYCNLSNGGIEAVVTGGVPPYNFLWSPSGNTFAGLAKIPAGLYQVAVTDKNNCKVTESTTVLNNDPVQISLGNDTTLCPGNRIILSPGIFNSYQWQDSSRGPSFTVVKEGIYSVQVIDDRGCSLRNSIKIIADCGFIFFPSAFTPNNDGRNDFFGAFGNLNTVRQYTLHVYDRYGNLVFQSNDPFKKWDGKVRGINLLPDTFVWIAKYNNKGETNIMKKGTVTLLY
jgi:gliding motility-associated-like protein